MPRPTGRIKQAPAATGHPGPTQNKRAPKPAEQDIFDLIGRSGNIEQASEAMQAMAHPLRLKILCLVGPNELNVQEIVEAVGTSQSNISQHLGILRERGILQSRKEANKVFYRVEDPRILKMISLTRDIFCSN
jgi:ArsR family transcriptional regulator